MGEFLAAFTFRSVLVFASTAFSLLVVMLVLNIITVDEVVAMLNLSPEAAAAFKSIMSRVQEVSSGIIDVISQLLTKLMSWAGIEVDLNKIEIDVNQSSSATPSSGE